MMNNRIKSVKEIKKLINEVLLPGYSYKTNFSCADFLIDINYNFIIKAELVKQDNKMIYVFVLDTQFLSEKVIFYEEMQMVINIIKILENNRKFVLSRLKKYTVEEYEKEKIERERKSEMMLEALKTMFIRNFEGNQQQEMEDSYYE